MSKLLIEHILKEDASVVDPNVVEKLIDDLRKKHGVSKSVREILKKAESESGGSANRMYSIAYPELLKLVPKSNKDDVENIEGIDLIDNPISSDTEYKEPDENPYSYTDEGFVDVLKYLAWLWKSKDRVRVLAKRFDVHPDLYAAAGLGNIPEDPTDEDIWNTMDMSRKGDKMFINSTWQPYYMDTLEKLDELPDEVKEQIRSLLEKAEENKVQYESVKLVEDIAIATDKGVELIAAGSIIKLLRS